MLYDVRKRVIPKELPSQSGLILGISERAFNAVDVFNGVLARLRHVIERRNSSVNAEYFVIDDGGQW